MQSPEVSGAVRPKEGSLGVKVVLDYILSYYLNNNIPRFPKIQGISWLSERFCYQEEHSEADLVTSELDWWLTLCVRLFVCACVQDQLVV